MSNLNPSTIFALLSWPLVAIWLYRTRPIGRATLWTILGAYMLLPVGAAIKFKMIPVFDKSSIPNLAAFFGCVVVRQKSIRFLNGFGMAELLIAVLVISPFITAELNGDQIVIGARVLPPMSIYDAGSDVIAQVISLIPFILGRQILRDRADTAEILRVLVIAGLIYSVPTLFEIRFSPFLHTLVYGYFPDTYFIQMRDGGFRPVVFMGHGLLVSLFICITAIAAAAFWRTNMQAMPKLRLPAGGTTFYLSIVLVLCKSAGSIIYGAVLIPLARLTGPRMQLRIAVLLTTVALSYPILRAAELIPTNTALDMAASISRQREHSLQTRFTNEEELLQRESQRFLFGWGRFGRGFIYDKMGNYITLPDGEWIIVMGEFGFIGFLAQFGLLALPVFAAASALRFAESDKDRVFLSAVTLIIAVSFFDLLPNSSLRPWTLLVAGALLGRAESLRAHGRFPKTLAPVPAIAHEKPRSQVRVLRSK